MNETDEDEGLKRSLLRRVKRGATSIELLHWLRKRHGVEGERPQGMLKLAARIRHKAARKEAALGALLCFIGFAGPIAAVLAIASTTGIVGGMLYYLLISAISAVFLVRYIVRFFKAGEEAAVGWQI